MNKLTPELLLIQKQMKAGFAKIKSNPMDMNNLMQHVATMSTALDLLIDSAVGSSPMFDQHMAMLKVSVPKGSPKARPQVLDTTPWQLLGQTVVAGNRIDLSKVAKHKLFFWSDQHFQHKNIIEYSSRPFESLDQMHETFIATHNSIVKPDDVCVWVGDVSFAGVTPTNEWLDKFNGYKILVVGNHDIDHGKLKMMNFNEIHTSIVFDNNIVTHHPWGDELPEGFINIHGHLHNRPFYCKNHVSACVEMNDYAPTSYASLMVKMDREAAQIETLNEVNERR